ncbi:hypothetical protein RZS08_09435, partial [Arthrospira platensis SPKY1]|nr:hypothetical protein [Arthrospira platensis SPKY1]
LRLANELRSARLRRLDDVRRLLLRRRDECVGLLPGAFDAFLADLLNQAVEVFDGRRDVHEEECQSASETRDAAVTTTCP